MNLKLISLIAAVIFAVGTFLSKFKRKKTTTVIYGGEDERKIHVDYENKAEEIKKQHEPVETKADVLKELNRYSNID